MVRFVLIMLFVCKAGMAIAETKTAIKPSELNQKILDDIQKNYPTYSVIEAFKVNNRGVITYEAVISSDKGKLHLYYNVDGLFLRKENPGKTVIHSKSISYARKSEQVLLQ